MQSINQHLLESITTSQKNSVFHEAFDSISRFLSASKSYGLLTPCTNFCVSLYLNIIIAFLDTMRNALLGLGIWSTQSGPPADVLPHAAMISFSRRPRSGSVLDAITRRQADRTEPFGSSGAVCRCPCPHNSGGKNGIGFHAP